MNHDEKNLLNEDDLGKVTGGTGGECGAASEAFAVPSCPKCSCTWLGFDWGADGQMKYICSRCGYTGNRSEFPHIMPPDQEEPVSLK